MRSSTGADLQLVARAGPAYRPPVGQPGLGVIDLDNTSDGVAYVARLLHRALSEIAPAPPRVVELGHRSARPVGAGRRARFLARLLTSQVGSETDWWMFGHLGVARAQLRVPTPFRKPYAVFLHGIECWDPQLPPDRQRTLQRAALLLANSYHTARRMAESHPGVGPVRACPLGLLPSSPPVRDDVDSALLERVRPDSAMIVGRMASNERDKGHDALLECWPRVRERVPTAQLVVVGRGDDRPRLEAKAAAAGLQGAVLFAGFASDATLTALHARVSLFAMPSEGEGLGLVYLEAMRGGLPCIGSRGEGAEDVIEDGRTGFLVPRGDREVLAARIVDLLGHEKLRRSMGVKSADRYRTEFTYDAFRSRLDRLIDPVFRSPGPKRHAG